MERDGKHALLTIFLFGGKQTTEQAFSQNFADFIQRMFPKTAQLYWNGNTLRSAFRKIWTNGTKEPVLKLAFARLDRRFLLTDKVNKSKKLRFRR